MRVGSNPNKDHINNIKYWHQIVIPVFIPNLEGYYKETFKIFKICIKSIIKTTYSDTCISVVNNGSCLEVTNYLNNLYTSSVINELIHTNNIGKLNSILKVIKSTNSQFITIADADVLFLNNWLNETFRIFKAFPKAGVVGLVPQFKMYSSNCSNILFENIFSKNMKFTNVINSNALIRFYQSLGWKSDYNKDYLKRNLTIQAKNGLKAIVGSGHLVATYKKEVFSKIPKNQTEYLLGGNSERIYLDEPVLKVGGWRLTTADNFAYHMGNVEENWMEKQLDDLIDESDKNIVSFEIKELKTSKVSYLIKNKIFKKIISYKSINTFFLRIKGLPKSMLSKY